MRKIFVDKLNEGDFALCGEDHLHVSVVLRAKKGDEIVLCCGDGYDYLYEIVGFEKGKTFLKFRCKTEVDAEPRSKVDLYFALPKGDKLELAVQKCVELGINGIHPFVSEHVQVKPEAVRLDRLNKIVKEAAQQCGRGKLPIVYAPIAFDAVERELSGYDAALFFYEGGGERLPDLLGGSVALVVGSEGGFSGAEAERLGKICRTVSLGKRILRAETAAIAATTLAMYKLGEL